MANFIEVKRAEPELFRFECDKADDPDCSEMVIINVDYIIAIIPKGDTCIIRLAYNVDIHAQHSAAWVMGLINGN